MLHIYIYHNYVYVYSYIYISQKNQKIALVERQQTPDLGLPPKKHLPETTSCKSELLTVKMGIKVTRLPTRVCHYVYVLNNYIPIPAGVYCLQYMQALQASNPEEWCSPFLVVQHTASPRDGSHKSMAVKWNYTFFINKEFISIFKLFDCLPESFGHRRAGQWLFSG